MLIKKNIIAALCFMLFVFAFAVPETKANGNEYKSVVKHLKTKYKAKKKKIPFMWLARFAVGVVRPAGVKSFNVTLFENLSFSRGTLDAEMQAALKNSMSPEWTPIMRVRSRAGEQVYMYMRESGESVKLMLVTIDKDQAAVIRARFNPEKLADFINDPKIFGISLDDNKEHANLNDQETSGKNVNDSKQADSTLKEN
jgi:hypothetical protein